MACYTSKLALWCWLLFRETLQGNDHTSYRSWIPQWWVPSSPLHWLGTAALWQVLEIKGSVAVNFVHNQSAWSSVKLKSIKSTHLVIQCSSSVCIQLWAISWQKYREEGKKEEDEPTVWQFHTFMGHEKSEYIHTFMEHEKSVYSHFYSFNKHFL